MNIVEFIGFVIAMMAMIFLYFRKALEERERRENPEAYASKLQKERVALKELYQSMGVQVTDEMLGEVIPEDDFDDEEDEGIVEERVIVKETLPPPPVPKKSKAPLKKHHLSSTLGKHHLHKPAFGFKTTIDKPSLFKDFYADKKNRGKLSDHRDAYHIHAKKYSIGSKLLNNREQLRKSILSKEIIGPPKVFQ